MVGILTFYWADNYGAMLQAYALKRSLEKIGEQVSFIPYAPYKLTASYWMCPVCARLQNGSAHYYVQRQMLKRNLLSGVRFWKRRLCMSRFRRRYLTSALPVRSAKAISLLPYKSVFVGSDQVWNPEITLGLDDAYIGNVHRRGKCSMIAYAASFGGATLSETDRKKFIRHVGDFHAVSVREQSSLEVTQQLLKRRVYNVLDPVLLLERSEWERIGIVPNEKDYVLLYLMSYSEPLMHYAQTLSVRYGKRLIAFANPADSCFIQEFEPRHGVGPAEFVGYIKNAYCVLTNSFHGTALSIILEKPFLVYCHEVRGIRQKDLLVKAGLSSHILEKDEMADPLEIWEHTDWEQVRVRIDEERTQSIRFIVENI